MQRSVPRILPATLELVMISSLAEVQRSYSLTDKRHGTVTFGPKETLLSKGNVAYVMLKAEGDAVKNLIDPHITIWDKNARKDSWISSVEFSGAGARHVYFSLKRPTFSKPQPHIPSSDQPIAQTLETPLAQFFHLSQIASLALTQSANSTSSAQANTTAAPPSVSTSSATFTCDWPSLGDSTKTKK
jgi:hypothetical protein